MALFATILTALGIILGIILGIMIIYALVLSIKALQIYIKNNSK
ncbi:MAG: hypothetical protein PHE50_08960 [Dehalococcoidales bacterium]|nr:hypothetical protein [Dehalococcoidales bacterium]